MSIDHSTAKRIANLARIELAEEEVPSLVEGLNAVLNWCHVLNEVNTDGVEPLTSVVAAELPRRVDMVTDGNCRDAVLANAPHAEHGFFTVPKVIE